MLAWAEPLKSGGANRVSLADADPNAIRTRLRTRTHYASIKRIIDIIIVIAALPGVIPVLLFGALLVLIASGRPVFFVQPRVGLNGRTFNLIKLRTMRPCTLRAPNATAAGDGRITSIGRYLRRSHLDELPQLWNVLVGDMTLIGPRPEQPSLVELYRKTIPHYDLRHLAKPGLSGLSQVCFGYASTVQETQEKLEYDLFYLQNFGASIDALVLGHTFRVFLSPHYVR